ncbi:MAG: hypothetical protein KDD62_03285 [Bdellovibrionales bacterium]|nr:hypothetical protein [Bdellovibrionales bacterium]
MGKYVFKFFTILSLFVGTGQVAMLFAEPPSGSTLFFATNSPQLFSRYKRDPIRPILLTSDIVKITGLAVWKTKKRLVLSVMRTQPGTNTLEHAILSTKFDGSDVSVHDVNALSSDENKSLVVNESTSTLYYKSSDNGLIFSLNLEQISGSLPIFSSALGIKSLAYDSENNQLYFLYYPQTQTGWLISRFAPDANTPAENIRSFQGEVSTFELMYNDVLQREIAFDGVSGLLRGFYVAQGSEGDIRPLSITSFSSVVSSAIDRANSLMYLVYDSGDSVEQIDLSLAPAASTTVVTRAELNVVTAASVTIIDVFSGDDGSGGSSGGDSGDDGDSGSGDDSGNGDSCDDTDPDGDEVTGCEGDICNFGTVESAYYIEPPCTESYGSIEARCSVDPIIGGYESATKSYPAQNCQTVVDECPEIPERIAKGLCESCEDPYIGSLDELEEGESLDQACIDECPDDDSKRKAGICGCGYSEYFAGKEALLENCSDECGDDPDKLSPGVCGCRVADNDSDGDGKLDCEEACPADPNKVEPGDCGCGYSKVAAKNGGFKCVERTVIQKPGKGGDKIIRNELTGEPLVPKRIDYEIPSSCRGGCKIVFEFGAYDIGKSALGVVLASKRKGKRSSKSSSAIKYDFTLNELSSNGVKTTKRQSKKNRVAVNKLKPGANYIGSYKVSIVNSKGKTVASSSSSSNISFRTPG